MFFFFASAKSQPGLFKPSSSRFRLIRANPFHCFGLPLRSSHTAWRFLQCFRLKRLLCFLSSRKTPLVFCQALPGHTQPAWFHLSCPCSLPSGPQVLAAGRWIQTARMQNSVLGSWDGTWLQMYPQTTWILARKYRRTLGWRSNPFSLNPPNLCCIPLFVSFSSH